MSYKGNSILGDKKYKKRFKKLNNINDNLKKALIELDRQFLHAKILGFTHPKTGKRMEFSSILPKELENVLKKLRKTY
jgi:23S rRNA pseudouridine1911/1915/1917 synthase